MEILIAAALLVGGAFVGTVITHYRKRTRMPKHVHSWDRWEDCGTEASPMQKRKCLSCNEFQQKTTAHVHTYGEWHDSTMTKNGQDGISSQRRWCTTCNHKQIRGAFDVD